MTAPLIVETWNGYHGEIIGVRTDNKGDAVYDLRDPATGGVRGVKARFIVGVVR